MILKNIQLFNELDCILSSYHLLNIVWVLKHFLSCIHSIVSVSHWKWDWAFGSVNRIPNRNYWNISVFNSVMVFWLFRYFGLFWFFYRINRKNRITKIFKIKNIYFIIYIKIYFLIYLNILYVCFYSLTFLQFATLKREVYGN